MLTRLICLSACTVALVACGQKRSSAPAGQALASVNGVEITVLQLNEELARAGVGAAGQEAASRQLLQGLIDRQLLQAQAEREKLDRDPKVMQAIDRARALVVAQAWLQQRIGNPAHPTSAEIETYFNTHPQFFRDRKQFTMDQLQVPAAALTPALKQMANHAGSLEEVASWLAANKVQVGRSHVARSTADLAPALSARLLAMQKGQIFTVQEGDRALVIVLRDVQEAPVTLAVARPHIEQFLMKQRQKELASAELARLRAEAKIEYLDKSLAEAPVVHASDKSTTRAPVLPVTPATAQPEPTANATLDRGMAGLK